MALQKIEKTKRDYTDKYVIVMDGPPNLARFKDVVGCVKTVNMNGHALVEFTGYHENIGWYDIDLDYLRVVDKPPEPEVPAKKVAAKPAVKKKAAGLSPLEMLKQQGAGKSPTKDKPKTALSPLEQLRQQGSKKSESKPSAKKTSGKLSPLEQLRQQGEKKGTDAPAKPQANSKPKTKLSPLEQLRQQGGAKSSAKPMDAPPKSAEQDDTPQEKPSTADILAKLRKQK